MQPTFDNQTHVMGGSQRHKVDELLKDNTKDQQIHAHVTLLNSERSNLAGIAADYQ